MVQGVVVSNEMPWLCLEETLAGSRGVRVGSGRVQGLVRASGVGALEWFLGEDLITGVTRFPHFCCGGELVLTPLFQTSNVLCTIVLPCCFPIYYCYYCQNLALRKLTIQLSNGKPLHDYCCINAPCDLLSTFKVLMA